jgi:hypothetical protein
MGQKVSVLIDDNLSSGVYEISLNGEKLSSGVYFYRIRAGSFTDTKKLVLLK